MKKVVVLIILTVFKLSYSISLTKFTVINFSGHNLDVIDTLDNPREWDDPEFMIATLKNENFSNLHSLSGLVFFVVKDINNNQVIKKIPVDLSGSDSCIYLVYSLQGDYFCQKITLSHAESSI